MINEFEFCRPKDLDEALRAMSGGGRVIPLAGGTNVLVNMKRAPLPADLVVDLTQIETLTSIVETGDRIRIGAGVTFADLYQWRPGGAVEALMHPMCRGFSGPLIRNLATIGGNLCDASPAADVSPVLLALDAEVELQSLSGGLRSLALADFFRGVRDTAIKRDELLTSVSFRRCDPGARAYYYKLGKRKADAISVVSVAMIVNCSGEAVDSARIALGAVAPVAMRASKAEAVLEEQGLNGSSTVAAASAAETRPIDDFRAGGKYRREMVEVLVKRGLQQIADGGLSRKL